MEAIIFGERYAIQGTDGKFVTRYEYAPGDPMTVKDIFQARVWQDRDEAEKYRVQLTEQSDDVWQLCKLVSLNYENLGS